MQAPGWAPFSVRSTFQCNVVVPSLTSSITLCPLSSKHQAHFCLSLFLLKPFYLSASPGMSTLDHHGVDDFLSFISHLCSNFPSNFNITLPFGIYSTSIIRIILNCLLNSCSFPDTFHESRDFPKFVHRCIPD